MRFIACKSITFGFPCGVCKRTISMQTDGQTTDADAIEWVNRQGWKRSEDILEPWWECPDCLAEE